MTDFTYSVVQPNGQIVASLNKSIPVEIFYIQNANPDAPFYLRNEKGPETPDEEVPVPESKVLGDGLLAMDKGFEVPAPDYWISPAIMTWFWKDDGAYAAEHRARASAGRATWNS